MARVIIHVWFPYLAADRLRRNNIVTLAQTLVLTSRYRGADHVVATCPQGRRRGLQIGMRLADARALCPDLISHDANPTADAQDLHHLALWARRYCPLTAPDHGTDTGHAGNNSGKTPGKPPGQKDSGQKDIITHGIAHDGHGIWLDVAGATHLYGGVRAMLADMLRRLRRVGLRARLAAAPTCGAAWALARYGRHRLSGGQHGRVLAEANTAPRQLAAMMAPLPLAALRIDMVTCSAMATAGLRVIGDILGMPRAPLASRFGNCLIERLDAALGHINESFAPIAPPRPLLAIRHFAEPVAAPDDINRVIRVLAQDIGQILAENGLATRRLRLGWQRVDGTVLVHDTHLSRPSRDVAAFHRLLADVGATIDPEFGLENAWMEARFCSPQAPVSRHFNEGLTTAETYASLVDRLVARLGYGAVLRPRPRACWQPEAAQYMALPDMEDATIHPADGSGWHEAGQNLRHSTAAPRPVRLLSYPQPVSVVALLPDHPPAQFIWQNKTHRISRASGPERIAPQWWTAPAGSRTRDYFRLQDEQGARFWVYREGLPERGEDVSWFLHGFFA